jgi:holo-[acyl-carrier protein] synthase
MALLYFDRGMTRMIVGIGVDVCSASRWERLLGKYGERSMRRIMPEKEVSLLLSGQPKTLPERVAGRWALREAIGKAMGTGLSGWSLPDLQYETGRVKAGGRLKNMLDGMGVGKIHATLSHDRGFSVAIVVLES